MLFPNAPVFIVRSIVKLPNVFISKSAAPLNLFVNNSLKKYLHKEKGVSSKRVRAETLDNAKHL
ncbi:hypothetical protein CWC16_10660 [Pseudoalteromonas sp. S3776]|nr:hypothetical protein CWC16_10660 [Pseudoalteromonas sp. S3776]